MYEHAYKGSYLIIFYVFYFNIKSEFFQQQTLSATDKKKKNFSFSKRFPFMKSKDQSGSEDISADERKLPTVTTSLNIVCKITCFIFSMFQKSLLVQITHKKFVNQEYSSQKMEIFIQSVFLTN